MIKEYLDWYSKKIDNIDLAYHNYIEGTDEETANVRRAGIWQDILDLCYKEVEGVYWFAKFILGDLTNAGYPNPIIFNGLWYNWAKLVAEGDHIAIKCSRQHGKSTFWTVIQPVYRTALYENYNVLITSASEDQAMMMLGFITRIIENNEFLTSKKAKSAKWSTTEMSYNGGKIVGKGVGSEVRGGTYDYILCDDVLRSDNKLSDEDISKFIDEELEPMIFVRRGQMIIVGTPKSESDIFSDIEQQIEDGSLWKLFTYPAILDMDKKEILCPDRFTWDQLMQKKKVMGQLKFDKEFMCQTYSSGSQLFPAENRKMARELGRKWKVYGHSLSQDARDWQYYIGVDVARAGTASADFTVVTVIAYNNKTQHKRIVWIWKKKGLKIPEQAKNIAMISKNFNHPVILVEKNNIGQDLIDDMIDNYNLNVEAFTTGGKGQGKEDLIRMLMLAFENEKMILPCADRQSREMMEELEKELDRFVVEITKAGNEVFKGSGRSHDDMVISLALANRCSQSHGYSPFAFSINSPNGNTALERFAASGDQREIMRFK